MGDVTEEDEGSFSSIDVARVHFYLEPELFKTKTIIVQLMIS